MFAMLTAADGRLCWTQVPDPVARPGEVVIDIRAAALNRADLLQRAGKYPPPPGWPEWMGLEVAGVIRQAPAAGRWHAGDEVCALLGGGGYAEQVAVPEGLVMPAPRGLPMEQAAALPEVFATAYLNLCLEAGMKAGDTVFIQAGASGLGMASIQLAKALGAKVVTTVGSESKAQAVRGLGADVVVRRNVDDLARALDNHPPDIVLDCVGGPGLGEHIGRMAPGGRWILIATLGGEHADLPLRAILKRGLRLVGSTLRSRSNEMKGRILRDLEAVVWPRIESGALKANVYQVLPMEKAEEAHAILGRNENVGKVVLTVRR